MVESLFSHCFVYRQPLFCTSRKLAIFSLKVDNWKHFDRNGLLPQKQKYGVPPAPFHRAQELSLAFVVIGLDFGGTDDFDQECSNVLLIVDTVVVK
jgi:hypothetical protein